MRVKACAKINLFLEITGKRPDGYHTLTTIFQTISLADELTLAPSRRVELSCSDPTLPTDDRNLVFRAAVQLREALKEPRGAAIHLKKVVPTGAGLGGGSGDAGAVLMALLKFWKRRMSMPALKQIAVKLGADVPFFLKGGTCAAGGIGDQLRPLPRLAKTWLVLIYPGFGVSTQEAYARVRLPLAGTKTLQSMSTLLSRPPAVWTSKLYNRFEEVVFPAYPRLLELKHELIDAGAIGALMSGSGSSVFGVMKGAAQGRDALVRLREKYPQSWLVHTV